MKTEQEIFDIALVHLLTQNKRSVSPLEGCLYRGPEGRMCGAGPLILDSEYTEDLEGEMVPIRDDGSELAIALMNSGISEESFGLVRRIQDIHDNTSICNWAKEAIVLANNYGLNTDAITEVLNNF